MIPAIMIVNPTPIATPRVPTSVWRTLVLTCVQAMSTSKFMAGIPDFGTRAASKTPGGTGA